MTNALKQEKSRLEKEIDRLGTAMLISILVVVLGLIVEYLLEFIPGINPNLIAITHRIGGGLVTLGVIGELVVEFMHGKRETRVREINDSTIAELNALAEHERLARVKLVEQLVKPHVLTEEARNEMIEILKAYPRRKRAEVFVYDGHLGDVLTLADSINATFGMAGWKSHLWIGHEPRMYGTEATFGIARECSDPTENVALQHLAWKLLYVLSKLEIRGSVGSSTFSTTELPTGPLKGWGIWDPRDVAMFRVQIGQRQLTPDLLRPVTPPQA
jgi:hypothetical protein